MIEQRIAWGANNAGQAAIPQGREMTVKEMKFKFCSPAFIPPTNCPPIAPDQTPPLSDLVHTVGRQLAAQRHPLDEFIIDVVHAVLQHGLLLR